MMNDTCSLLLNTESPSGPFSDISPFGITVSQKSYGIDSKYQLIGLRQLSLLDERMVTQLLMIGWCRVCGEPFRFTSWGTIASNLRRTCPQHRGQLERPTKKHFHHAEPFDLEAAVESKEERE